MMEKLDKIGLRIKRSLDSKDKFREKGLSSSRRVIRICSEVIKMAHRGQWQKSQRLLKEIEEILRNAQK